MIIKLLNIIQEVNTCVDHNSFDQNIVDVIFKIIELDTLNVWQKIDFILWYVWCSLLTSWHIPQTNVFFNPKTRNVVPIFRWRKN